MIPSRALLAGLLFAASVGGFVLYRGLAPVAPDTVFTSIKGERLRLGDLRGSPVLVSFWASDCVGCIEEIPDLEKLHGDFAARGLRVITVAMPYDPPNRVVELTRGRGTPYPVALDPDGRITQAFGVKLVPNSFLIGPDGRVARHLLGRLRADDVRQDIERMLGKG
jgi:peroxiredoxin